MKTHSLYLLIVAGGAALFMLAAPVGAPAQIETAPELPPQALALVKELADQNKQLAANQTAMELKIDEVAEAVRQARLFSARAGRGGK